MPNLNKWLGIINQQNFLIAQQRGMLTLFNSVKRARTAGTMIQGFNRHVVARNTAAQLRLLPLMTQNFATRSGKAQVSQIRRDYELSQAHMVNEDKNVKLQSESPQDKKKDFKVPDYQIEPESLMLNVRSYPKEKTQVGIKDQHPLESMAKMTRARNDVFMNLLPEEVVLTNLPSSVQMTQLDSKTSVMQFLVDNVHKDLQVKDVQFLESLSSGSLKSRTAYIKVKLGSKRQAQMVKKNLRKTWLHDCLIKIRTLDDSKAEAFDNRTVILNGLPKHLRAERIIEYFGLQFDGAIVGIEMPMQNTKLRDLRQKVNDMKDQPQGMEKEIQRRRAVIAVEEGLNAEQKVLGRKKLSDSDQLAAEESKLEQERVSGILRLVSRLQAEGKSVVEQRLALLDIKEKSVYPQITSEDASQTNSIERLRGAIEENKDQVTQSLNYLRQNQEALAHKAYTDPLSDLLRLGKEELAMTYDRLIEALEDRERAIEHRLRKSIEHYGIAERILQQGKDYSKELEDVPTFEPKIHKVEEVISVGQQVYNVIQAKNMRPEEKVYRLLSKTLNPFEENKNFSEAQLIDTTNPELDRAKYSNLADPRIPNSLQHLFHKGTEFLRDYKEIVDDVVSEARAEFNTPFDELYHQQKQVIQDVIDAEKALQDKIKLLKDPVETKSLDVSKLTPEDRASAQDILDQFSSPFTVSQQRQSYLQLSQKLQDVATGSESGSYKFDYSEGYDLRQQIQKGMISKKQADMMQLLLEESNEENLGYAFMTFSHADEARLFLLQSSLAFYELDEIDVLFKSHLDHSNMDMQYFLASARNAAQTVDEIQAVKDARQRLREFELNLDSQLPSRKRLQKMRRFAQSLIEDHESLINQKTYYGEVRSELDQARFERKVKEFEAANPDIDLTAIYDNEKTEAARRTLHKKAYASYKAFHFLKNGVKRGEELLAKPEEELSSAKKRLKKNDPYNFPALDQTVKSVLSADISLPRLNDIGEPINTPGRRINGYTQHEFLEAYFGKDASRRLQTATLEDPLYKEQKSLKEQYPLNSFLKMPGILDKREKIAQLGTNYDPAKYPEMLPEDNDLAEFHRHRRNEDYVSDHMQANKRDFRNKEGKQINQAEEFQKSLKKHNKKYQELSQDLPDGKMIFDRNQLGKEVDFLDYTFGIGEYEDENERKSWFEMLRDPKLLNFHDQIETKMAQEQGVELSRMYPNNQNPEIFQPHAKKNDKQARKKQKKQGDAQKAAKDELTEAKFEPSKDDVEKKKDKKEFKNRRERRDNEQQKKTEVIQQGKGQDQLRDLSRELSQLKQGHKSQNKLFAIGRDGELSLKDKNRGMSDSQTLTEKDYIIGRQMASMSQEERKQLQLERNLQRSKRLENLLSMQNEVSSPHVIQHLADEDDSMKLIQQVKSNGEISNITMNEADYIEKDLTAKGKDPGYIPEEDYIDKFGDMKSKLNLAIEQRRRAAKFKTIKEEAEERLQGSWFRKYQTQVDKEEKPDDFSQMRRSGRMLDDFIKQGESTTGDAEEDEDVFLQYQEMANRTQSYKKPDNSQSYQINTDVLTPKMPGFEDYFKNEADGVHPFDKIIDSFDESEINTPEEKEAELAREKMLYERQLLGKLMGQRLTAREYELVAGFQKDETLRRERVLDVNNKEFLEQRQQMRLLQEMAEQFRRRQVISGEWSEEESQSKLKEKFIQIQEDIETGETYKNYARKYRAAISLMRERLSSDMEHEKEYYFDEGVGVSLQSHTDDLKARFPEARVQTRRDREGFAIVKLSFKPEFKYNIDKIMAMNTDELNRHQAETLEILLKDSESSFSYEDKMKNLKPEQLAGIMNSLVGQQGSNQSAGISAEHQLQLRELAKQRAQGRYRDDVKGFKEALDNLIENINSDSNQDYDATETLDFDTSGNRIFEELFKDRQRFRSEIAYQLRAKINKHTYGQKRTEEDFVKPRFNEESLLASVGRSVDNMEQQVSNEDTEHETFDREAFEKLKRELSERKKMKEDMLSGTLPRFKPYLRL